MVEINVNRQGHIYATKHKHFQHGVLHVVYRIISNANCVFFSYGGWGRFPFDQKFRNFRNGDKWHGNFQGKVPENPEIVEFPKSGPFNRKFWKCRDENQMEQKFPEKYVRKFGYTSRGCPLFRKLCKFAISYSSALVLLAAMTVACSAGVLLGRVSVTTLRPPF